MIQVSKFSQIAIAASVLFTLGGMPSVAQTPPSDTSRPMRMTPEEREQHRQEMMERMQGDIDAMRQMITDLDGMSQMTPEEMAQHHQQMREQMQEILSHMEEMQQRMERHHGGMGSGSGQPGDRMPMPGSR